MKRLMSVIAALCIAALAVTLTGCGEKKQPETTAAPAAETTAAETKEETPAVETTAAEAKEETTAPAPEAEPATEAPAEAETQAAEAETQAQASGDLTPSITIEYGDIEAIEALAKDAQNFKVEEGTVVQISGVISTDFSNPSIQESDGNGGYKGITMFVDGEWEKPANHTDIDVIGTFVKGTSFMEFHVSPENITVK